jgi:glucose-1-phosphate adenylyltransferase
MGILALDDSDRIVEWQEKPRQPKSDLASMGVYVFSKRALHQWLSDTRADFGHHVIPAMIEGGARVFGYRFDGYWQDVGTVQSYWEANLALLSDAPELDLYDREWVIHTRSEERAPAKIGATAQVHRSLISHGCVINGSVVNSVLSPGVVVDVGAVVRDSIVLFDSVIRPGAVVDRAILDKEVAVGPGAIVGEGTDYDVVNRREPGRLNTGITVVGKRAVVPRGVRIGRNVLIGEGARAADFLSRVIRSGSTVERTRERGARLGTRAKPSEPADRREPVDMDLGPTATDADGVLTSPGGRAASGETSD